MKQQGPGDNFDFLKKLSRSMGLTKEQLVNACFTSVISGDWEEGSKRGKTTRFVLRYADFEAVREDDALAHELESNLAKKYKDGELKRGNHRKYLYAYTHNSWNFNQREGGAIVSAIRSYEDFLNGKKPTDRFREFARKDDPFDSAYKKIKNEIKTFGSLAAFDFLQILNYVLDYKFLKPSYLYSKNRGKDSGVPRGMRYLIYGNYNASWKDVDTSKVRELEREIIETAQDKLDWPERKLVFDLESAICTFQKPLDGDEEVEKARKTILNKKYRSTC